MRVLGIDPGIHTGMAVVCPGIGLLHCETIDRPRYLSHEIEMLCKRMQSRGLPISHAVVELQYVGANIRTSLDLARLSGRWQEACESNGLECHLVQPSQWQSSMLDLEVKATSKQRKHAAIDMCHHLWQYRCDEHSADAALMALWLAQELTHDRKPVEQNH